MQVVAKGIKETVESEARVLRKSFLSGLTFSMMEGRMYSKGYQIACAIILKIMEIQQS